MALKKNKNVILTPKAEGSRLKYPVLCLAAAALFLLAACGDEVTEVTEVTHVVGMQIVEEGDALPKCTTENEGEIVYSVDSAAAYYCVNRTWTSMKGKDGVDGKDGADGKNGKDGVDGKNGDNGADGKNGENGADGKNCEIVSDTNGVTTLKCDNDTTTLYKAMCNLTPYDPMKQYCSLQGIFDLEKCGGKLYNPESHFCDTRDSSLYRYVTIGSQFWMAENLNYKTDNSWCGGGHEEEEGDCSKYGRLYTWTAAVGKSEEECGAGNLCELSGKVRGVCPEGWRLPDTTRWKELLVPVGAGMAAGKILRSQTGWNSGGNGTDAYGFSALPAGYKHYGNGKFACEGKDTYFWSTSERDDNRVWMMSLSGSEVGTALLEYSDKANAFSVRCIKDKF
ncbi:MAG: hypothetical protein IKX42_05515 [Fibrobacter sp.]|nr:hypothetical protein [Fibrobacter sp.]